MKRVCVLGVLLTSLGCLAACSGSDASPSGAAGAANSGSAGSGAVDMNPPPTTVVTSDKFGEMHSGDATFYTFANGAGACLYDPTSDFHIAALNISDWADSAWCGACADLSGPNGTSVRVRIVDECPDCAPGQLDLHPDAFAALAPKELGRIQISWSFVACDAQGPVRYKYKDGSNPFWTAVQVRNSRYPIAKLESSKDGMNWSEAGRQGYNYFLNGGGFGSGSTQVRITAFDGKATSATLIDTLPDVQAELEVSGQAQFQ